MRAVALIVLVLLALVQSSLLPRLPLLNLYPDLVLVAVLSWTTVHGVREGAVAAFVGGLLLDLLSGRPLGSQALALLLTALPVARLSMPAYRENLAFPILGAFVGTLLYHLLLLLLAFLMGEPANWGNTLLRVALPLAVVEAVLMVPFYLLVDRLDRRSRRRIRIG